MKGGIVNADHMRLKTGSNYRLGEPLTEGLPEKKRTSGAKAYTLVNSNCTAGNRALPKN